jgi:chromosome segregation protein Spc25
MIYLTVAVMTSSPQLPTMAILVNNLNEDHDLYTFIRKVHEDYEMMVSKFFTSFNVFISHALFVSS